MSMPEPPLTATQPNGADPSQDQVADNPDAFACTGRLLSLVRKLIDYGKDLAATLQQRTAATNLAAITRPFGKIDIALILARITQGLHRAAALEARLIDRAQHEEAGLPTVSASPPRQPRAAPSTAQCPSDADSRIARLPTPEQIPAEVRRRPVGAVIADICHDLGIMPGNLTGEFWGEIAQAIIAYGGSLAGFVTKPNRLAPGFGFGPDPESADPSWPAAPQRLPGPATGPP
jgi:hypothetical protein